MVRTQRSAKAFPFGGRETRHSRPASDGRVGIADQSICST
jgi:hypothetical protein